MDLSGWFRAARQRWTVLVAAALVAATAVFLVTPSDTGRSVPYTAVATLVQTSDGAVASAVNQATTAGSLDTLALFVTTGEIPVRVATVVGYSGDPRLLASQITVRTDPLSGSLTISTTSRDGAWAAGLANAFADESVAYFSEQESARREARVAALEDRLVAVSGSLAAAESALAADPGDVQLQAVRMAESNRYATVFAELQDLRAASVAPSQVAVLERAAPVASTSTGAILAPVGRPARVAIGAFLGLLLGLGLVVVLERADARIRSRADVLERLRLPVLAEVPRMARAERSRTGIALVRDPLKAGAEAYRAVRSALLLTSTPSPEGGIPTAGTAAAASVSQGGGVAQVVLVTSGHAREGKTTSVANLAAGLAEIGRRVLVLDADFRAPNAHEYFDVAPGPGISDHLGDPSGLPLEALLRPTNVPGVTLVTAGTRLDTPAVLPSMMRGVVARARDLADVVIIDSAPMLHANDALDIIPAVDTVLLVVRSGRLSVSAAHRVSELLNRFHVPVLGAVLVGYRAVSRRGSYGYNGYGYGYATSARSSDGDEAGPRRSRARHSSSADGTRRERGRRAESRSRPDERTATSETTLVADSGPAPASPDAGDVAAVTTGSPARSSDSGT